MAKRKHAASPATQTTELKIVGGKFRGRKLRYEPYQLGDEAVTRPMKHRVREAIFNLVGIEAEGTHAVDLFAGTGALGLEALSRGAARATFIERHVPTARVIEENIRTLGVEAECTLLTMSAFVWAKRDMPKAEGERGEGEGRPEPPSPPSAFPLPPSAPWLVFCSPPFDFFVDRCDEMLELLRSIMAAAPGESVIVVESDERFDFSTMPTSAGDPPLDSPWDVRIYAPAVVGVWRKPLAE